MVCKDFRVYPFRSIDREGNKNTINFLIAPEQAQILESYLLGEIQRQKDIALSEAYHQGNKDGYSAGVYSVTRLPWWKRVFLGR
jgi:hypothetical protein